MGASSKMNLIPLGEAAATAAVAARIRALRRAQGRTLDQMSQLTGLDKSFLSRVERGEKAPSIATLLKLAHSLGVQVGALFGDSSDVPEVTVVRRDARRRVAMDTGRTGYAYEAILTGEQGRRIAAFVARPGVVPTEEVAQHPGEEMVLVLSGRVELILRGRTILLDSGDVAHFEGSVRHQLRRVGATPASVLVVIAQESAQRPVRDRARSDPRCIPRRMA